MPDLRSFGGQSDVASHRQFATAAEGKTVDGSDDRFTKILNEFRDRLPVSRVCLCVDRSVVGHFTDICAGGERLVASSGQNDAPHIGIITRVLKGRFQFRDDCLVQRVEYTRPIERHIRNQALLFIENVFKLQCRRLRGHNSSPIVWPTEVFVTNSLELPRTRCQTGSLGQRATSSCSIHRDSRYKRNHQGRLETSARSSGPVTGQFLPSGG